jgi:hypothetical protein
MTVIANLAEHVKVGRRRVVLVDPDCDWRLRVSVNLEMGACTIQSGNGDLDDWADDTTPSTFSVDAVDADFIEQFGRLVIDSYVGDERIADCIEHLIQCQS